MSKKLPGILGLLLVATSCMHTQSEVTESFPQAATAVTTDPCSHDKTTFRCVKYIKNYDADTVKVDIHDVHPLIGEKVSVRVRGIDTPEKNGKNDCEKKAAQLGQQLTESLLKDAKRIDLSNLGRDKYFRILADVTADGKSVKELLLKNKLAYEYNGKTKSKVDWCRFTKP